MLITPLKEIDMEAERLLFNRDDNNEKRSRTLDDDCDHLQVPAQFLLLGVLKKTDSYRSSALDITSLISPFLQCCSIASATSLERCFCFCTEKLKNWDTVHWYPKAVKNTHFIFAPSGPQTFPKYTFMAVR